MFILPFISCTFNPQTFTNLLANSQREYLDYVENKLTTLVNGIKSDGESVTNHFVHAQTDLNWRVHDLMEQIKKIKKALSSSGVNVAEGVGSTGFCTTGATCKGNASGTSVLRSAMQCREPVQATRVQDSGQAKVYGRAYGNYN